MKVVILPLLIGLAAIGHAQPAPPSDSVRLDIFPGEKVGALADDFIGFGYEASALAREGFFSPSNKHMVELYRTLSTNGLVRIGGIIGDHTRFEPEGKPVPHDLNDTTVINRAVLMDLGGFLRATGWKALWALNLGTGTKEEAAQEAVAVQAALGDRLQGFEIGNEVTALKRFGGSYERYHAAYLEFKASIRAALPDSIFSGPDVGSKSIISGPNVTSEGLDWAKSFAHSEAKDMSLLLVHYYRAGKKAPQATIEALLGPHPELDETLKRVHEVCVKNDITYRINETNSFSGGGKEGVSDTFAAALWSLDYMFRVAAHGGAGVNMETDVNHLGFVSHYSPIFRKEDGTLVARPEYYGMLAFSLAGKGNFVRLTTSEHTINLTAYATRQADGTLWLSVINRDLSRAANLELPLPEGFATADAFRLTAPSVESKTDVTLAGAEVDADGTWSPRDPEKLSFAKTIATLKVPAASAVLVRLKSSGTSR